jgi:hypothetical protein
MKKIIILSLVALSTLSVNAQRKRTRTATSQGNVAVRFGMDWSTFKNDKDLDPSDITKSISFRPSIGYLVIDNLELGVNFDINNTKNENISVLNPTLTKTNFKKSNVQFGIYAQKYFPLNNWFALYANANLGINTGSYETKNTAGSLTTIDSLKSGSKNGVGGGLNFGFQFTPHNSFGLSADIAGFNVDQWKDDPTGASNNTISYTDASFRVRRPLMNLTAVWHFGRGMWRN